MMSLTTTAFCSSTYHKLFALIVITHLHNKTTSVFTWLTPGRLLIVKFTILSSQSADGCQIKYAGDHQFRWESVFKESFCPIKCESVKISQIIQFPRLPLDPYYKLLFKLFHQLSNWQTSSELGLREDDYLWEFSRFELWGW